MNIKDYKDNSSSDGDVILKIKSPVEYVIDFDKIQTLEDIKAILKVINFTIRMHDESFEKHPYKHLLKELTYD